MQFQGVSFQYNYKDMENDKNICYGFIAQQIEESLENNGIDSSKIGIVGYDTYDKPNANGLTKQYYLSYPQFISLNTHMTQKAHHRIDSLESKLTDALSVIESLKKEIETLKQAME